MKQLAQRYARALYSLAKDAQLTDQVLAEMRVVAVALSQDADITAFIASRLIRPTEKVAAFEKMLASVTLSEPLKKFLLILARKGRLGLFAASVDAYQTLNDQAHGVTRGVVRAATLPGPEERTRISDLVSRATNKQVILTYQEDPSLLGGLVAEVGSMTFDDSLITHLRRMNEQLNRSVP